MRLIPDYDFFFQNGTLHLSFPPNVPELLKADAAELLWAVFGGTPVSTVGNGSLHQLSVYLGGWLDAQISNGSLYYDHIRDMWRYLL